jgi:hypothetical protein
MNVISTIGLGFVAVVMQLIRIAEALEQIIEVLHWIEQNTREKK